MEQPRIMRRMMRLQKLRTPELRHVLSHQVLLATGYLVEVDSEGGLSARYRPVAVGELDDFAAPVLLRKLEAILSDSR